MSRRGLFAKMVIYSLLVLMMVSGYVFASELANTPWPKVHGDIKNTGQSQHIGPSKGIQDWIYNTGGKIYGTSVIGINGEIIFTSESGKLYALNPNGTEKWIYNLGAATWSPPAIASDGTVYAIANKILFALDQSGNLKWKLPFNEPMYGGGITIDAEGNIYFGTESGKIIAVSARGEKLWDKATGGKVRWSTPGIGDDGTIYAAALGPDSATMAKIVALTPQGIIKWEFTLAHMVCFASPAIGDDGNIYVTDMRGGVYCIAPNGNKVWSTFVEPLHSGVALAEDGSIYIGGRTSIVALLPNGETKWNYCLDAITVAAPVVDCKGNVYIGTLGGKLHSFSSDGVLRWEFAARQDFNASPTIGSDGTLYIGSLDGYMYAIKYLSLPDEPPILKSGLVIGGPNPFTEGDTIRVAFSLEEVTPLKFQVYDMNGELVRTFDFIPTELGYNEVEWDGEDKMGVSVDAGIYICVVAKEVNNRTQIIAKGTLVKIG